MNDASTHPLARVSSNLVEETGSLTIGTISPVTDDGRLDEELEAQVRLVWARLAGALAAQGFDVADLVRLSIQVADGASIGVVREYIDGRLAGSEPAIVMTSGVLLPGVKVQIDAEAARPVAAGVISPTPVATVPQTEEHFAAAVAEEAAAASIVENAHLMSVDPDAESADDGTPAFVARPVGSEVYHGFPVLDIPDREGWRLGAVSGFGDGSREGDAFVVAPDGSRAGVVWSVGAVAESTAILPASDDRWGVFSVVVPRPMGARGELVENLAVIVAELAPRWAQVKEATPAD